MCTLILMAIAAAAGYYIGKYPHIQGIKERDEEIQRLKNLLQDLTPHTSETEPVVGDPVEQHKD